MEKVLIILLVSLALMFALMFYLYYRLTVECERLEHELHVVYGHLDDMAKFVNESYCEFDRFRSMTIDDYMDLRRMINANN